MGEVPFRRTFFMSKEQEQNGMEVNHTSQMQIQMKIQNTHSLSLQSVACALLASLPLCLSESASGLSHVVKVSKHRNKYKDKDNKKHEYKRQNTYYLQLSENKNNRRALV